MATAVQPKTSIHALARRVFQEAKGDETAARQRWLSLVRQDSALLSEALNYVADVVLSGQVSQQRAAIIRTSHANEDRGTRAGDRGLAARDQSNLMAFPLPESHKPLGQATRAEVQAALLFHRAHRQTHGTRERWFGLIWQAMKNEHLPVKRQLSEMDLRNLEVRARKEEASR